MLQGTVMFSPLIQGCGRVTILPAVEIHAILPVQSHVTAPAMIQRVLIRAPLPAIRRVMFRRVRTRVALRTRPHAKTHASTHAHSPVMILPACQRAAALPAGRRALLPVSLPVPSPVRILPACQPAVIRAELLPAIH